MKKTPCPTRNLSRSKHDALLEKNGFYNERSNVVTIDKASDFEWDLSYDFIQYIDATKCYPGLTTDEKKHPGYQRSHACSELLSFYKPLYDDYLISQRIGRLLSNEFCRRFQSPSLTETPLNGRLNNPGFFLVGVHGAGKRMLLEKCFSLFPSIISLNTSYLRATDEQDKPTGQWYSNNMESLEPSGAARKNLGVSRTSELFPSQIASRYSVSLQARSHPTTWITRIDIRLYENMREHEIYEQVFLEIDRVCKTNYAYKYGRERRIRKLASSCKKILDTYTIGVVVFWQCHTITKLNKPVMDLINRFFSFFNVPFITVSNPDFYDSALTLEQSDLLSSSCWITVERMACKKSDFICVNDTSAPVQSNRFGEYMMSLFKCQWTHNELELDMKIIEAFYLATAGIKELCLKLFYNVQIAIINNEMFNESIRAHSLAKGRQPDPHAFKTETLDATLVYKVADQCFAAIKKKIKRIIECDFKTDGQKAFDADVDMSQVDTLSFSPQMNFENCMLGQKQPSHFELTEKRLSKKERVFNFLSAYYDKENPDKLLKLSEYIALNSTTDDKDDWLLMAKERRKAKNKSNVETLSAHVKRMEVNLLGCDVSKFRNAYSPNRNEEDSYRKLKPIGMILDVERMTHAK